MQLEDLARQILVDADLALRVAALDLLRGLRVRADGLEVVQIQQHRRVRLDREQQLAEVAEHVRPDGLALEAAGEAAEQLLVDRDREVIGPELRQPLEERPLGRDRGGQPRGRFGNVDWLEKLRQPLLHGVLRIVGDGAVARLLDLAPQAQCVGEDVDRGTQPGVGEPRRRAAELRREPAAAVGSDGGEIAGAGPESEAIGGDRGAERRVHRRSIGDDCSAIAQRRCRG